MDNFYEKWLPSVHVKKNIEAIDNMLKDIYKDDPETLAFYRECIRQGLAEAMIKKAFTNEQTNT